MPLSLRIVQREEGEINNNNNNKRALWNSSSRQRSKVDQAKDGEGKKKRNPSTIGRGKVKKMRGKKDTNLRATHPEILSPLFI